MPRRLKAVFQALCSIQKLPLSNFYFGLTGAVLATVRKEYFSVTSEQKNYPSVFCNIFFPNMSCESLTILRSYTILIFNLGCL